MKPEHIPNIISVLRLLLIPPAVWYLFNGQAATSLLIFIIAGASDGIDGLLARRYGWITRLGSILDPLADKFMMASIYIALGWLGHLPVWLVATVLGRDVFIIAGALGYHFVFGRYDMEPHLLSKLNTVLQIALVVFVLLSLSLLPLPELFLQISIWVVMCSTVLSGMTYFTIWYGRARERRQYDR
ncbi:MAG: CDP-alcohol phosphatidyltransferase family protein [Gammaproteobacteria bacterium]|nr:CDP-alcohol phosphatidyltransferase family protein [Gammaproteobacteria bacterium]